MLPLRKIVIPTDFSESSLGVIELLGAIGLPVDAKILFLHVFQENVLIEPMLDMAPEDEGLRGSRVSEALEYLRAIAADRIPGSHRVECIVRRGSPATEIVKLAEHHNAGLIVMATHGRSGLAHMFLGSVAERVVRTSQVPVLTWRPPEMGKSPISTSDVREQLHLG